VPATELVVHCLRVFDEALLPLDDDPDVEAIGR